MKPHDVVICKQRDGGAELVGLVARVRTRPAMQTSAPTDPVELVTAIALSPHESDVGEFGRATVVLEDMTPIGAEGAGEWSYWAADVVGRA